MTDRAAAYVDYQQRASEFVVGDLVFPFVGGNSDMAGRVMAVYPAIGMVDVEWPYGSERFPVEDLQRVREDHQHHEPPAVGHDNIPGGLGVSVPGGPVSEAEGELAKRMDDKPGMKAASTSRVAEAFVKRALYWASADRQYRATSEECGADNYTCPKCKVGQLRKAIYKRRGGASEHLYGCPECMFLIKREDIIGHPEYLNPTTGEKIAAEGLRVLRRDFLGGSLWGHPVLGKTTYSVVFDGNQYLLFVNPTGMVGFDNPLGKFRTEKRAVEAALADAQKRQYGGAN